MSTISVVIATYNGEKYIASQLTSILKQTRTPDEVLIFDDCSTDRTVEICRTFIQDNQIDNWYIVENEKNQGWRKNFFNGFCAATGEYIFPCDQDDVWHLDKIERMITTMETRPDIMLLASNYNILLLGSEAGSKGYIRQERKMINNGEISFLPMNPKWLYVLRPGCTYCFHNDFFRRIRNYWDVEVAHDALLWRYACALGGLAILNESLIDFVRHGDNATSKQASNRRNRMKHYYEELALYENVEKLSIDDNALQIILQGISFQKAKIAFYKSHNIFEWICLLIKYHRFYLSLRGGLADLIYGLKRDTD